MLAANAPFASRTNAAVTLFVTSISYTTAVAVPVVASPATPPTLGCRSPAILLATRCSAAATPTATVRTAAATATTRSA